VKIAVVSSEALAQGRKILSAGLYAHPTFAIDKAIARTRVTLRKTEARLERQLAERQRLLDEHERIVR